MNDIGREHEGVVKFEKTSQVAPKARILK